MSNVNCITKDGTDYMYEDTAGRKLIGVDQDDTLVAKKAYAKGELFWYNNELYKAIKAITSGATIVVGTDAEKTTVSDELKSVADGSMSDAINSKLTGKLFGTAVSLDGETVSFAGINTTKSYMLQATLPDDYDGPAVGMANVKIEDDGATPPVYTVTYTVTNATINMSFDLIELG